MGGFSQPGLADLRLWGSLGKVPVAIVAGTAVSWLSIHFEAAVEELMTPAAAVPLSQRAALAPPRFRMRRARLMPPIPVPCGASSER